MSEAGRAAKAEVKRKAEERANRCLVCNSWEHPKEGLKSGDDHGWCPHGGGPTRGSDKCITGKYEKIRRE